MQSQRRRVMATWAALLLTLAVAACGADEMTVAEYAEHVEDLVGTMVDRFEALDTRWESEEPTVEGAHRYWDDRLDIRNDFLEAVEDLRPPERIASMHATALDVFTRITDADRHLAALVDTYDTIDGHWPWVDTPQGRASDAVLAEVYDFCRQSQDEFDATQQAEAFEGQPWVPQEMQQIVKVAFGCPPSP